MVHIELHESWPKGIRASEFDSLASLIPRLFHLGLEDTNVYLKCDIFILFTDFLLLLYVFCGQLNNWYCSVSLAVGD